jgi:hypothetical protein
MFAATAPGLGPSLAGEIGEISGATVTDVGADGRSDLVMFDVDVAAVGDAPAAAARHVDRDVVLRGHRW